MVFTNGLFFKHLNENKLIFLNTNTSGYVITEILNQDDMRSIPRPVNM